MFKSKFKQKPTTIIKLFVILALLAGLSGCRALSDFFDPDKNSSKKQLKVVNRDKPNLADETEEREVDPDSAELIEATDEELANDTAASDTPNNTNELASTNTAEPSADSAQIEQKAKAIVGKWKPADSEENIIFEFTEVKREGDTFVGTFNFYANGDRDEPSKYIVSRDAMIKLIQFGKEHKIEISVSADGNSMRFTNQDGEVSNLIRTNAQPNKQPETQAEEPRAPPAPQQPKATPRRPEIPQ